MGKAGKKSKVVNAIIENEPTLAEQSRKYTLSKILATHDLVEVVENNGDPFIIVSERSEGKQLDGKQLTDYTDVSVGELGTSSASPFTSWMRKEYNRDLIGIKGLQIYDKMRKSDGTVRGTLRSVKTPVLAARWFIEAEDVEKKVDVTAAEYVWKNLTHMSISWPQVLVEAMLMCEFGYYMFEIVWEEKIVDGVPRLWVRKLAPRHPMDVKTWHFDANGGPAGVTMYGLSGNPLFGGDTTNYVNAQDVDIPISKLLVFTFDREAGDIEGISILRSAYKHWYYIDQFYKIDSIQKERHGIGIPCIKLPPGFSHNDKIAAENLGRNLRTNERAHVVLPPNWEIMMIKLEGQPVDCLTSIKEHKQAIRENILLGFMDSSTPTKEEDQTMFLKATRFIADIVCETFNLYLIPKMIDANFQRAGNPTLKARRIGEQADWRTLSFAIRNLIGAGALVPDDKLEEMLREEMDLPLIDKTSRRIAATPMNKQDAANTPSEGVPVGAENAPGAPIPPGSGSAATNSGGSKQKGAKAGLPRQTPPPSGQQKSNSGTDHSGGK